MTGTVMSPSLFYDITYLLLPAAETYAPENGALTNFE